VPPICGFRVTPHFFVVNLEQYGRNNCGDTGLAIEFPSGKTLDVYVTYEN